MQLELKALGSQKPNKMLHIHAKLLNMTDVFHVSYFDFKHWVELL